ncbi:MAG TPA: tetratricopeptide repeat protein [Thermoanaerobaculia bacterium]
MLEPQTFGSSTAPFTVEGALDRARVECQAGRLAGAEALCRQAVAEQPDHAAAIELLGMVRCQAGDPQEAIELLTRACDLAPESPAFLNNLGIAHKNSGQLDAAVASYERALALAPDMTDALLNLGVALRELRRNREATDRFRDAAITRPSSAVALYYLADALTQERDLSEADRCYRQALAISPRLTDALQKLGALLLHRGRVEEAVVAFAELVRLTPDRAESYAALAGSLLRAHRLDEALGCCQHALALDPGCSVAHNNLGAVLTRTAKHREAEACFRRALEIEPDRLDLLVNLVIVLRAQGRLGEATETARRALAKDPERAEAHYYLASLKDFARLDDPDLLAMQRLAESPSATETQRLFLSFGLGKAFDDLGQHDRAFGHFACGNRERRKQFLYEVDGDRAYVARVIEVFQPEMLAARSDFGHPSRLPVFIVGMPRAGKTLAETLLARHRSVHAAGERGILQLSRQDLGPEIGDGLHYPEHVLHLTREQALGAAERHLRELRQEAPGASRVVNTMPGNYLYVGLIHLLFPDAPIVHCVRDPKDTCLSCYFKLFNSGWDFTYDLETLGHNYVGYRQVMKHWQRLLPGKILDVRYEEMVADPEATGRRLARFCGRTDPPTGRRPKPAKPGQARTAADFHSREVGRWRRYRAHLGPLERILSELYPGGAPAAEPDPTGDQASVPR